MSSDDTNVNPFTTSNSALVWMLSVCLFLYAQVGCSALNLQRKAETEESLMADAPTYKVIFAGKNGEPTVFTGRVTESMTVQDALEESGATKKFRAMLVDLARVVPENGNVLRLPVNYEADKRKVTEHQNYGIHAGDEILVRKQASGPIESLLTAVGGPARER